MQNKMTHQECSFSHALIPVVTVFAAMFSSIVLFHEGAQIPLVFGCLAAGLSGLHLGYTWEELRDGMIQGISSSLEAIMILLMIGMLTGSWIASGTVPSLIAYGLRVVKARIFLPSAMAVSALTAFAIGSWGTVGTIGLAFMGIGVSLGIPAPLTAGAVVSGAYMGEVISPLSDAVAMTQAAAGGDIFAIIKKLLPLAAGAGILSLILYAAAGLRYGESASEGVAKSIDLMLDSLKGQFSISPLALLPLALVLLCILGKIPAAPAMLFGAMAGMLQAFFLQGEDVGSVFKYAYSGYVCHSGNELMDTLFTAGGMESMQESVSLILIAMAFGGIMEKTGQMKALVSPILSRIRRASLLPGLTAVTCAVINMILPEQYLGISLPGRMYAEEYRKRGLAASQLGAALLGGGAATSALVPWNTCGVYCGTVLQVSAQKYMPYAYFGFALPLLVILAGGLTRKKT